MDVFSWSGTCIVILLFSNSWLPEISRPVLFKAAITPLSVAQVGAHQPLVKFENEDSNFEYKPPQDIGKPKRTRPSGGRISSNLVSGIA